MPANDVSIHIEAEDRSRQAFRQAEQSLESLEKQTREVQQATRSTAVAMGLVGNESQESAVGVTNLGRSIFRTSAEAKKFGGVFQDQRGRLREANGEYAKTNERVEQLGRTFRRTGGRANDLDQGMRRASGGANILTRSVGSLGGVLGALGIAAVTHEIGRFGISSVQTAGRLDQLQRALVNIEGSSEKARVRFDQLVQVANRPGLQLEQLVQYSNRLSAAGVAAEDIDKILLTVGETVVSLGGSAATSALAMEQLIQSFQLGKVDMRDFRTVIQQIPSLLETLGDVHGVQANIDGLHEAFARTGGSIRDLLIPVFDELSRRFEAPPDDSYIVVMDTLENSFKLFQGAVGDLFLPTIIDAAQGLSTFFEAARAGLKDLDSLPQPIRDIVLGAKDLYDGLLEIAQAIGNNVGPEIRELLPALSTLLGGVLELAGAIANALAPAYKLLSKTTAVVVGLITKLAQDITGIIGVLTDFVNWVSSAWREEERFVSETERVTEAIENVEAATKNATTSTQGYQSSLRTILEELASVNTELETKKARLDELKSQGLEPTDASLAQIVRRIALLEERSKSLTSSLPDLNQALEDVNAELETKRNRLAEMTQSGDAASASAEHLSRSITNLTALASLLNTQIAQTTTELTETAPAADTATAAIENYSLTLARLKATAEDAKDTLSDTINFQKLGANYQAAIAASDGYYNRQIANAEAALAKAEANSDEYFKIETNIFNLQRERQEARKKLTEDASKVGETEAERRVEIAEKEHERLRGAGEETARALEASEKRRTAAAEAEQKRLTQVHEDNLKQREEAERASNERIVKNSEEQLSALSNAFENAVPESVDRAYDNIQSATVAHYETLKNQARQRITDEDALNAELVSLDRQRNAALEDNHRTYLQRIASDAKNLLGERTDAFKSASDDILHNWDRTVSEFERQLREADTEDALRAIEADFETAQQSMLASLESVLTELGFTAEQAAEIMKEILRTAEGEADGFADKIISAFQRLGKAADRETKQQNRQIERNYRELVGEIEHILSNITDFFIEITRGGDIEDAFRQLGERVAESFLDVFTRDLSENLAASLSSIASETDLGGAASGGTGAGGAIQAAGGLSSILTLITSPVALAAIVPAAVFATTKYIGDKVGQTGVIDNPNRQGRPLDDEQPRRRRGESQSAYERRLQANADAETAEAERQTFFGNYDPRAPFGRAIQESGVFTGDSGYFAEHALRLTDVDVFGNIDLPGLVTDLEGILQTRVEGLGTDMERAAAALENTTGADIQPALQGYLAATGDFYQTQIDFANFIRRTTGHLDFGDVEGLSRQLQESLNQARLQDTSTNLTLFGIQRNRRAAQATAERTGTDRQFTEDIARAQYGDEAYDAEVARVDDEVLAAALQANQESIAAINTAIAGLDASISQSNDPVSEIEQLLQQIAIQIPERYRLRREALQQQLDAGDITQAAFDTSLAQLGIDESAELERNSDAMLENALLINRQAIEAINVQVAGLENAISQSNDPAEIESLLLQIAQQIPEIYRLRREALSQQFAAGEITLQSFNTSIAQLNIEQSAALEQNSDQRLANTLLINQQQTEAVSSVISELENRISQSNDPAEIARLLMNIAAQIPEIYRLRRNALSQQYAAGEITLSAINTGLANLNIEESAALERNSDAVLANTLRINQEAQTAISTEISALEQAIATSNDPVEIVELLMQIAEQIPEIYHLRREALQKTYDAGEITKQALETEIAQLNIAESAALEQNSDAQLANALTDHNADIQLIANTMDIVSEAIRNSDDPAEIAQLLVDLRSAIMEKYLLRREFLQKQLDAEELSVKQYEARLGRLNIEESAALGSADSFAQTETQGIADTAQREADARQRAADQNAQAAQRAADEALANALRANQDAQNTITVEISRLENAIAQSNDPAEIAQLLQQIAEQIPETYRLRKEALQTQFDAGKLTQEGLENGIASLDIEQSAALEQNSDAILANALSINQQAVAAINTEISGIENAISQSNDPAEIATLLQQIAVQIPEIYRLRREALQAQYDAGEITLSALQTGVAQLNIEESAALEQNSDAMLANALRINQHAAEAINTHIAGLEGRISDSNDPVEISTLLQQIAVQIPEIYRLRREALQKQFDAGEITLSTLQTGLAQANIDESAALERNSDEQLANTLGVLNTDAQVINTEINSLSEQIRTSNDPAEIARLVVDLQTAVMEKYRLQREVLQKQLDAEELTIRDFNAQLGSINLAETSELTSAAALGGAETDDLRRTSNALLQNAIQRAQFNLTGATTEEDFETRRQELLRFITEYYDAEKARIDALMLSEAELRDQQEDNEFARQRALQQATDATNRFAEERIQTEERLQDEIADLRDDGFEAEADRLASLEELQARHNARILDLEEDFQEDLDDLRRERLQDAQDLATEYQRDIQDLQNEFARELFGDSVISFADLTAEQQRQLQSNAGFQQERFDLDLERDRERQDINTESGVLRAGSAGYEFYRQQLEGGQLTDDNLIEQLFGRQGLDDFIDLTRGTEDAQETLDQAILDVNQDAVDRLTEIDTKLGSIDASLSLSDTFENIQERIEMGLTPFVEGITEIFDPLRMGVDIVGDLLDPTMPENQMLLEPSVPTELIQHAPPPPELIVDSVSIQANSVSVNGGVQVQGGGVQAGGGSQPQINVTIQPQAVVIDGQVMAQVIDGHLVTLDQEGRTTGSYTPG